MQYQDIAALARRVKENIGKVIIGKTEQMDLIPTAVIAGGHVLLEDVLAGRADRDAILDGEKRFDAQSAREIYPELRFLPMNLTKYAPCMCGKACDLACYRHLKESGKL